MSNIRHCKLHTVNINDIQDYRDSVRNLSELNKDVIQWIPVNCNVIGTELQITWQNEVRKFYKQTPTQSHVIEPSLTFITIHTGMTQENCSRTFQADNGSPLPGLTSSLNVNPWQPKLQAA